MDIGLFYKNHSSLFKFSFLNIKSIDSLKSLQINEAGFSLSFSFPLNTP
jgi:hypothetical protein